MKRENAPLSRRVLLVSKCAAVVAPMLLSAGCGDGRESCSGIAAMSATSYRFDANVTTAKGIEVDTSGQAVDLAAVDCIVDAFESCFRPTPPEAPSYRGQVDRGCVRVKIAPDWRLSTCGHQGKQIFPCDLRDYSDECRAAAETECPCACAGVVQDFNMLVVTPDLAALSHELTHVVTDYDDPFPASFQPCADGIRADNCRQFLEDGTHARSPAASWPTVSPAMCGTKAVR